MQFPRTLDGRIIAAAFASVTGLVSPPPRISGTLLRRHQRRHRVWFAATKFPARSRDRKLTEFPVYRAAQAPFAESAVIPARQTQSFKGMHQEVVHSRRDFLNDPELYLCYLLSDEE